MHHRLLQESSKIKTHLEKINRQNNIFQYSYICKGKSKNSSWNAKSQSQALSSNKHMKKIKKAK